MAPRMREEAKQAGPKDRARSGTGGRSGGESHGELDRRKIRDRIAELQEELDAMGRSRRLSAPGGGSARVSPAWHWWDTRMRASPR